MRAQQEEDVIIERGHILPGPSNLVRGNRHARKCQQEVSVSPKRDNLVWEETSLERFCSLLVTWRQKDSPSLHCSLGWLKPDGRSAPALGELFLATEETLTPQDLEPRAAGWLCLGPFLPSGVSAFPTALRLPLSLLPARTSRYSSQGHTWFPDVLLNP